MARTLTTLLAALLLTLTACGGDPGATDDGTRSATAAGDPDMCKEGYGCWMPDGSCNEQLSNQACGWGLGAQCVTCAADEVCMEQDFEFGHYRLCRLQPAREVRIKVNAASAYSNGEMLTPRPYVRLTLESQTAQTTPVPDGDNDGRIDVLYNEPPVTLTTTVGAITAQGAILKAELMDEYRGWSDSLIGTCYKGVTDQILRLGVDVLSTFDGECWDPIENMTLFFELGPAL